MFKSVFDHYPELRGRSNEERRKILDHARYMSFKKRGSSTKLVILLALITILGLALKLCVDLMFVDNNINTQNGFITFTLLFPIFYYTGCKSYAHFLRPEIHKQIEILDKEKR